MNNLSIRAREDVLVVGAGPVGLTMACELARHGIRPRIIDRLVQPLPHCRAIGVTPRTLEVWEDMGIVRGMIDSGIWLDAVRNIVSGQTVDSKIDLSDLPFAMLGLPQNSTERLLARHLSTYGVDIERGVSLEGLSQSDRQVQTVLLGVAGVREEGRFRYVVGCDGAHSAVRKALDIAFEGSAIPAEFILGDVHIDWTVPRGMMLRLVVPPDGPGKMPDVFVAVPLPEMGRYRVSIIAPPDPTSPPTGTGHGTQSERAAPGIEHLQSVADRLLPEKAVLSDLRWSSIFRIGMRLAANYRKGNVFIAGDAAHIHPPTGGQGMNTGIQDAYNLAWKLALVSRGAAEETLLESYEAERRAVGADVIARTTRATQSLLREKGDRLADTQVLISYRGSGWIGEAEADGRDCSGPLAGDRAPDCLGLRRSGVGFPLRFFEVIRGVEHVLVAYCPDLDPTCQLADLAEFTRSLSLSGFLRSAAIIAPGATLTQVPGIPVYQDMEGKFADVYGCNPITVLIRPDKYLAWRGESWRDAGLRRQLARTFHLAGMSF
jgi:2-polyprenyl-6-methoxyphenol hydroxylase-like FAD-dependent oxidoreductase